MTNTSPTSEPFSHLLWDAVKNVLRPVALAPWRALRWCARGLYRRRRGILYAAIVLVLLHLAATLVTGVKLNREIAQLKTEGYILPAGQLTAGVPAGQPNAAPLYQQAFDARRISQQDTERLMGLPLAKWTPELSAAARRVVSENQEYYRLVTEAAHTRACAFPTNWEAGPLGVTFPEFARLRETARMLQLRVGVFVKEGRSDDALGDAGSMLRMSEHAQQSPTLIGQLVGYAIQGFAVRAVRDVLSAGTPSLRAARELMNHLAAVEEVAPSVRAMKGELVLFGLPVFDLPRHGSIKDLKAFSSLATDGNVRGLDTAVAYRAYGTLGRPLLNLDEMGYLRAMREQIDAFSLPWPRSQRKVQAIEKMTESLRYQGVLTAMIMPVFERAVWSRELRTASLGDAQIALALVSYKSQHGAYPESLAALEAVGFALPKDPFGGRPYRYRREGAGFVVYSIGSDMKDDGGLPPTWDTTEKLSTAQSLYRRDHYDVPFRCPR